MKKTISVYWPIALIVPLAVVAWAHAGKMAAQQMPLAAEQVSAELARAVSYGLVGADRASALKTMPASAGEPASRAI
ncbi:MAG TPA: hypothetical protein VL689_09350 [Paraburkholderia sp.]|jgi:hypothetical protein|nr:hypothetical protein [Paraburkholderia sp.]